MITILCLLLLPHLTTSRSGDVPRPVIKIAKDPVETMDVTLSTFGHELAFHIIHPVTIVSSDASTTTTTTVAPAPAAAAPPPPPPPPPLTPRCISWRQTGDCDPNAKREADHDLPCDNVIHTGSSGYCECEAGRKAELSTCEHASFTCQNICTGSHIPIPLDYKDIQPYFQASTLFEEMKPSNVNSFLGNSRPFFLIVLCDCAHDVSVALNKENEESNWPIHSFEVEIRKKNYQEKFSYVYVLPSAARHFSLYDQYSISRTHPHVIIDNIPNGPMNEKFLSPFTAPGQSTNQMVDMVDSFFNYTLPLLVRSAKKGRGLRGAMSDVKADVVVEVTSDTFQEIVLDPTRACFLLIYSPTCPASRSVLPILDDVAKEHADFENVTIAKIDLTSNDLPVRDVIVHHYPTGYLFPAGSGTGHHPLWRKPVNFASYDGESTPHDRSKPHSHWSKEVIAHFVVHEVMPENVLLEAAAAAVAVAAPSSLTTEEQYTLSHQNIINQKK